MAFTHPDIDALVADHKLHGEAIALLRRKSKVAHPLLQNVTDEAATLKLLTTRKDELLQEISTKMASLQKTAMETAQLVAMANGQTACEHLSDAELGEQIAEARKASEAAELALRVLQLEARRRRGAIKAEAEIANLSPQARELLKQTITAPTVPATTTVRG